jgi:hypothetical protein
MRTVDKTVISEAGRRLAPLSTLCSHRFRSSPEERDPGLPGDLIVVAR